MRSQNIKYNSAGRVGGVSCLSLFLLTFLAVNPFIGAPVFAEEDYGISTQAAAVSAVSIAFLPTSASGAVTPVDATNGDKAKVDVRATVRVQNSGGYSVYVGSESSQLKNGEHVIDSVVSTTTYASMPVNRWGYSFQEGTTAKDGYEGMSATLREKAKFSNSSVNIKDETRTFTLSFAANIGSDKPAGTYSNNVTMSVVSSPLEVTNVFGIAYMQDMTPAVCNAVVTPAANVKDVPTAQLIDKRDNKTYWVAKLADGNCWMMQNLDLDIPADGFTSDSEVAGTANSWKLSDMSAAWTNPTAGTTFELKPFSDDVYNDSRSWSQGLYVLSTPIAGTSCDNNAEGQGLSTEGCQKAGFVDVSSGYTASNDPDFVSKNGGNAVDMTTKVYDAHYLVGNWYQWNAAVAGTGATLQSIGTNGAVTSETDFKDVSSSVCPKGWRLPRSGRNSLTSNYSAAVARDDSFKTLSMKYNPSGEDATTIQASVLAQSPLFFIRGGAVHFDGYLTGSGDQAYYWSSIADTDTNTAYLFAFIAPTHVVPSDTGRRFGGRSVRCVAR